MTSENASSLFSPSTEEEEDRNVTVTQASQEVDFEEDEFAETATASMPGDLKGKAKAKYPSEAKAKAYAEVWATNEGKVKGAQGVAEFEKKTEEKYAKFVPPKRSMWDHLEAHRKAVTEAMATVTGQPHPVRGRESHDGGGERQGALVYIYIYARVYKLKTA